MSALNSLSPPSLHSLSSLPKQNLAQSKRCTEKTSRILPPSMALLCFLLDLRTIPPSFLRTLKQCLLQLANYYAISRERRTDASCSSCSDSHLPDRLALAYIHRIKGSPSSSELKIAYTPGEKFSLRDFHHAVNNMPQDSFSHDTGGQDATIADKDVLWGNLFSSKALYAWCNDDMSKKVVAICISPYDIKTLRRSLMDAADQCISVEFVTFESAYILPNDTSTNLFDQICDLENCVIRHYTPDTLLLQGLFKQWLEELNDDIEKPLQAIFHFKNVIFGSLNKISCNLAATANHIMDAFMPCQACRCHGLLASTTTTTDGTQKKWCKVSGHELELSDIMENSLRIGKDNILFLPSFGSSSSMQSFTSPISFNVMERTSLASLDEGVIVGTSYRVYPSSNEDEMGLDVSNAPDQNILIFKGLCGALFHLDQGLVCSSMCNIETMRDATFLCYYLLIPSQNGQMLLRRLAGSEEVLPIPDMSHTCGFSVPKEVESSIQASLSKIAMKDYNPLEHERGFHTKLNGLVKESLQFRFVAPLCPKTSPMPKTFKSVSSPMPNISTEKENRIPSCVTDDWEQLIILDDEESAESPSVNFKSKPEATSSKILSQSKPMDEKTTRILERLEPPPKPKRQQQKNTLAVPANSVAGQIKKPLLPFDTNSKLNLTQGSQPMRPNFQRMKKKQKT